MTTTKERTTLEQQKEDLRGMILMLKQLTENEKREIKGIMIGMQLAKNIEPKKTAFAELRLQFHDKLFFLF